MILNSSKISIDTQFHIVTYNSQEIALLPEEYQLLVLFLKYPRHVLSYKLIVDQIGEKVDQAPTHSTVTPHIQQLKQAFKKAQISEEIVERVDNFGYRLKPLSQAEKSPSIMITPSLALMQKFLRAQAIEYIVIDQELNLQSISPGGYNYCDYPEMLQVGQPARKAFPELTGLERIVTKLIEGKIETFELPAMARNVKSRCAESINFFLIADPDNSQNTQETSLVFVFLEDNSEQIIYRQRLVQSANETFLLLEKRNISI